MKKVILSTIATAVISMNAQAAHIICDSANSQLVATYEEPSATTALKTNAAYTENGVSQELTDLSLNIQVYPAGTYLKDLEMRDYKGIYLTPENSTNVGFWITQYIDAQGTVVKEVNNRYSQNQQAIGSCKIVRF